MQGFAIYLHAGLLYCVTFKMQSFNTTTTTTIATITITTTTTTTAAAVAAATTTTTTTREFQLNRYSLVLLQRVNMRTSEGTF